MVLYQGLRWDHLPWPCSLTCWHPSGSHAAITLGWPQHMFVYPGIKWVCGDFTGSALHYPALKFRYPESSHKGTADGVRLAPQCCPVAAATLVMNSFRHPRHGQPLGGAPSFSLSHYILLGISAFQRVLWYKKVVLALGLGTQVSGDLDLSAFLQCCVVMVKGEATMSSNTCTWVGALTCSLFLIETTTTKFISGMITHKTYEPAEAAKIDPSFFSWEGKGKQSPLVPIILLARKNISV